MCEPEPEPKSQPEISSAAANNESSPSGLAPSPELLGEAMRLGFLSLDLALPSLLLDRGTTASGSTAIAVMITPSHLVCANVGDSRAVLGRRGGEGSGRSEQVVELSHDHKPTLPAERARIEGAGGRVVVGRVDGSLAMSRALGDFELKDLSMAQHLQKVSAEPEIVVRRREAASDEMLVVACDGVWDVMSSEQCCACLR